MDVEVNLSAAGRNTAAITVTTTDRSGFSTQEVLMLDAAQVAVTELQQAIRAVKARRRRDP